MSLLFPDEPRSFPGRRSLRTGLRAAHIFTSGVLVGGHVFDVAREMMVEPIRRTIRADIGGDEQMIASMDTRYHDITFKHVLLPVWISAYRYRDRVFRFLVNGRTGEVQGERPWSPWKIAGAILGGLAVVAVIAAVVVLAAR